MFQKFNQLALFAAASAVMIPSAHAAVVVMDSATFSGTAGDEIITGFVAGANSSTGNALQGAVVASASGEYFFGATDPGSDAASLSGLQATTGLLNTPNGVNFVLGSLASDDILFLLEYDFSFNGSIPNDDALLALIDASGNVIGDYNLELSNIGTGGGDLLVPSLNRESGNSFNGEVLRGVTFRVSDFMGTTGDLSQVVGVTLIGGAAYDDLDVSLVGRVVVPEPASASLVVAGALCMIKRRRASTAASA